MCGKRRRTQPQSEEFKIQIKVKHLIYYTFFLCVLLAERPKKPRSGAKERDIELNKRNY